jgi:threonine dehydrogenase-like Zn-dependent dehydrogenase
MDTDRQLELSRCVMRQTMKAAVFLGPNRIAIREKNISKPSFNEALVRVTLTTICGTDLHILRREYPVKTGLTIGHELVGGVGCFETLEPRPLLTHDFTLDQIEEAYNVFGNRKNGVLKVAIRPHPKG